MKNIPLIVLSALVIIGVIGTVIVMNAQTTGQAFYQVYERPSVVQRVLTTEKCEPVEISKTYGEIECLNKGRSDCESKYPLTPGGATNYCLEVCINQVNQECLL
ncbi:hypothetical protein JW851_01085 [Candidatus Woesearchaeota archaeon]|nr:hypothetical protein [Candidatus Woesearchaeota archaeon]